MSWTKNIRRYLLYVLSPPWAAVSAAVCFIITTLLVERDATTLTAQSGPRQTTAQQHQLNPREGAFPGVEIWRFDSCTVEQNYESNYSFLNQIKNVCQMKS